MHLPVHNSFRGVIYTSLFVIGLGIFVIINNSKEKSEYEKVTGRIEFFSKEYQNLPTRDKGDYRYLKIETYPYPFEIYEPNSIKTEKKLDDLAKGDTIDIYFFETSYTGDDKLNRYVQFIDKDRQPYFVRNHFKEQLGYVIILLGILLVLMAYFFWKKGKLEW